VDPRKERSTAVLDVSGLQWASEQNVVAARLGRRPGVLQVEVNPVAQTATVVYDPAHTSLADLCRWVRECGYHCAGQSVPAHICDPLEEPDPPEPSTGHHAHTGRTGAAVLAEHEAMAAVPRAVHDDHAGHEDHAGHGTTEAVRSPHDVMGHGGHAGMSMAAMVADMRNRFLVAALFSILIIIWSPIGTEVFGLHVPVPFGLRPTVAWWRSSGAVIPGSAW
jgi:Cu2+-exporting ATPase